MRIVGFIRVIVALTSVVSGASAEITINPMTNLSSTSERAREGGFTTVLDDGAPTSLIVTTGSVSQGPSSSDATHDLSNSGFVITINHARGDSQGSFGRSIGFIYFSSDADVSYSASGTYTATDPDGRQVFQTSRLTDVASSTILYEADQRSEMTANESFTLGLTEGDHTAEFTGSLTGTLLAGREYEWVYDALIQAEPSAASSSATAVGDFQISFTPIPSVPALEGPALLALLVCLAGLGARILIWPLAVDR